MNLSPLSNHHKGEACFVIGNGPSLKDVPNHVLEALPSFGSNRIYLKFVPTYFVAVNPLVIAQFKPDIDALASVKFLPGPGDDHYTLTSMPTPLFSYNPVDYIYEGYTVTFVSLQLAFFMGFQKVYLVGVDHKYDYMGVPNEAQVWIGPDPNHFDPTYFEGHQWHTPDLERSREAYFMAKKAFEGVGRSVVNCTPNSQLDAFPFEELP
jgi:hypothetical protein